MGCPDFFVSWSLLRRKALTHPGPVKRKSPARIAGLPPRRGELRCGGPVVWLPDFRLQPHFFSMTSRANPSQANLFYSTPTDAPCKKNVKRFYVCCQPVFRGLQGSLTSAAPVRNLLPTSRGFGNLHPSVLPRSQPPIKEGIRGKFHVPYTPLPKTDPDPLHLGSPPVFFVRWRECGSTQIIG